MCKSLSRGRVASKTRRLFFAAAAAIGLAGALSSCIEDGFTSSPSDQPAFSTDTLRMADLFTLEPSPTNRFIVYNRHDKGLNISSIRFIDDPRGLFRLNVDGMAGSDFANVEIRANDSIFVFVEATLPENGNGAPADILAHIEFITNGVSSKMPVKVTGQDAVRLYEGTIIDTDTRLTAEKPYLVRDSIVVAEGATLTIEAGARLYFHDGASLIVDGTLDIRGEAGKTVELTGDRKGFVAAQIPYEIMAGQWEGILFRPTSAANRIVHASIRNTKWGIAADNARSEGDAPGLYLLNSVVRNSQGYVLETLFTDVTAIGCELAEASSGIMSLTGGNHRFNHCTIANYYLFTALGGPAVQLAQTGFADEEPVDPERPMMTADFANCIIYGNGTELSHPDLSGTAITFNRCLLKSAGSDDDNFIECLWDTDPDYYTDRPKYIFDYRLRPGSPAAAAAYAALTDPAASIDINGTPRLPDPDLGAYQTVPEAEE
ncbi:MAG: hypothetical protein NC391_05300 [Alistipes timonensis]|nr:hypothetical protein [Alistipes timonensis]